MGPRIAGFVAAVVFAAAACSSSPEAVSAKSTEPSTSQQVATSIVISTTTVLLVTTTSVPTKPVDTAVTGAGRVPPSLLVGRTLTASEIGKPVSDPRFRYSGFRWGGANTVCATTSPQQCADVPADSKSLCQRVEAVSTRYRTQGPIWDRKALGEVGDLWDAVNAASPEPSGFPWSMSHDLALMYSQFNVGTGESVSTEFVYNTHALYGTVCKQTWNEPIPGV